MTFLKGLREHSPRYLRKSRQIRTALLCTEEVSGANFIVSFSHVVCRTHSAKHNGNIAYLQFVESTISMVNLYLYVDQLVSDVES